MTKIVIRGEYAAMVQFAVSTEKTRYYLNGFYVHPCPSGRGVRIAATDGHRMVVARDELGSCDGPGQIVRLPKGAIAILKKEPKEACWALVVEGDAGVSGGAAKSTAQIFRAAVGDSGTDKEPQPFLDMQDIPEATYYNVLIDGTFPDYMRVIPRMPDSPAIGSITANADYLAAFLSICRKDSRSLCVIPTDDSNTAPYLIRSTREDVFGVLMPFRAGIDAALPDWCPLP